MKIYPIVPTPFLDNGEIDYPSIARLVDFMAALAARVRRLEALKADLDEQGTV